MRVEGVILCDASMWCCTFFGCDSVEVDNVKIVGQWRYNSDGIDVVNSSRVRVRNCFVRSFDDALVVKGLTQNSGEPETVFIGDRPVEDVTFERCVVWCDWGRGMVIGAETLRRRSVMSLSAISTSSARRTSLWTSFTATRPP